MDIAREHVELGPDHSLRVFRGPWQRLAARLHHHPLYELTLLLGPDHQRQVGDHRSQQQGCDCVLLGPLVPHAWHTQATDIFAGVVIQFAESLARQALGALPEAAAVRRLLNEARRGVAFPLSTTDPLIEALLHIPAGRDLEQVAALLILLDRLAARPERHLLASQASAPGVEERRFQAVCAWIASHAERPLSQARVAARFDLTPSAFCRWFKVMSGRTFLDHLHELRVTRACQALELSSRPIAEIALACGFRNQSHFNRLFRRHRGCTPRVYRAGIRAPG